jgi:hypothetical protein
MHKKGLNIRVSQEKPNHQSKDALNHGAESSPNYTSFATSPREVSENFSSKNPSGKAG